MTRKLINIRMNVMCSSRGEIRVGHHLTKLQIGLGLLLLHSRDQGQTSDLDAALAAGVAGVPPPPLRE